MEVVERDLRETIALEIEQMHRNLECCRIAVGLCSCALAVKIARGYSGS